MPWEGIGDRMAEVDKYVEDNYYATAVCVMLENCLARDDEVWIEGCLKSIVAVEEL